MISNNLKRHLYVILFGALVQCLPVHDVIAQSRILPNPKEGDLVFGQIPKAHFPSKILYNVGPTFARKITLAHDGSGPRPGMDARTLVKPLNMREWRQILFELQRNALYADVLPELESYSEKVHNYIWEHAAENPEPILICNVSFEWMDENLDNNLALLRNQDGTYRLKDSEAPLKINEARYFGASIPHDVVCQLRAALRRAVPEVV